MPFQSEAKYTIVKDDRGRVLFLVGWSTDDLPTDLPFGTLFWDQASRAFHALIAAGPGQPGAWNQVPAATAVEFSTAIPISGDLTLTGAISLDGANLNSAAVRHIRTRFTVAQVNAGATVLTAIAGKKYRVVDAAMIAVGGNVAAVTTVDLSATQGAAGVVLMAGAQASLTRSAVVKMGGTGGTVLADGASYVANDANTAITIIKNGADITTATHVDLLLSYVIQD